MPGWLFWFGAVATLTSPAPAAPSGAPGVSCGERGGASPCVDSDPLWQRAGRRSLGLLGPEAVVARGELALAVTLGWVWHPLRLSVPSPEPEGRALELVEQAWSHTLAVAAGLGRGLALELAFPTTLHQAGAGPEGLASRRGPELASTAVRDPRVGVVMALHGASARPVAAEGEAHDAEGGARGDDGGASPDGTPPPSDGALTLLARVEASLPLGDRDAYASSGAFTLAPGLTATLRAGRWYAGAELAPRLRRGVALGETRVGSELWASLGGGFEVLGARRLGVSLEAWALPSLTAQRPLGATRPAVEPGAQIPAEWQLSLRSEPAGPGFFVLLSGGTGLPLSTATRVEASGQRTASRFAGPRAADVRAGLVLGLDTAAP